MCGLCNKFDVSCFITFFVGHKIHDNFRALFSTGRAWKKVVVIAMSIYYLVADNVDASSNCHSWTSFNRNDHIIVLCINVKQQPSLLPESTTWRNENARKRAHCVVAWRKFKTIFWSLGVCGCCVYFCFPFNLNRIFVSWWACLVKCVRSHIQSKPKAFSKNSHVIEFITRCYFYCW